MSFDLEKYYERIGWRPSGGETQAEILENIQYKHITSIPFEDLDAYLDVEISLAPEDVFDKLVARRRGGYCFEQNALLCSALNAAGIKTYGVLARVSMNGPFGAFTHRMNIAEADGQRFVADVGFGGDCFTRPLRLVTDIVQSDGRNNYRIVKKESAVEYSVQIEKDGAFTDMLGFYDIPALDVDFELGNFYTNHSPKSGFKMMVMCALPTDTGKITIYDKYATVLENGRETHYEVEGEERRKFLRERFGINMDGVELK